MSPRIHERAVADSCGLPREHVFSPLTQADSIRVISALNVCCLAAQFLILAESCRCPLGNQSKRPERARNQAGERCFIAIQRRLANPSRGTSWTSTLRPQSLIAWCSHRMRHVLAGDHFSRRLADLLFPDPAKFLFPHLRRILQNDPAIS